MRLVTFIHAGIKQIGITYQDIIVSFQPIARVEKSVFPFSMLEFLNRLPELESKARDWDKKLRAGSYREFALPYDSAELLAPLPNPVSCRDAYAFRQHVEAARRNRNVEMIPEFDEYPIFYFTNHNAITGPGDILCMKDHFEQLDFELEAAIVIGKSGRNIPAAKADEYIFGYTIMNDMSARVLQMEEMKLNLGPAKGKDFSTTIGPVIVTSDELEPYLCPPPKDHDGKRFNLKMTAKVNGKEVSKGNLGDMDWTFAEIVERVSYGVNIFPGEIIGSGTVGTGCFLELNGTGKLNDPNYVPQWLQPNDLIELEIEHLGKLRNQILKESDYSILAKKKKKNK